MKLPRFCIFCGKIPKEKTKEHVIPQWLIKLTGDINREINFGVDEQYSKKTGEFKLRKLSFSSLKFPACKECNEFFSKLENMAKDVVVKILKKEDLLNYEVSIFLDWLDKIRVGLWLGLLFMNRATPFVIPKFHIQTRISQTDRCVFIYELEEYQEGLNFVGIEEAAFKLQPSCFLFRINNLYILNISTNFLFSKNIGFPFPKSMSYIENFMLSCELEEGTAKIKLPLINQTFLKPALEIYQPMIENLTYYDNNKNPYNSEYVKSNCLDFRKGIGSIFYVQNNKFEKLEKEVLKFSINSPKYKFNNIIRLLIKQTIWMQNKLLSSPVSLDELDRKTKSEFVEVRKKIISYQKKQLKHFSKNIDPKDFIVQ